MISPVISNKTRVFEIFAVVITASGKFIFMDWLNWRFPFISAAIIFWIIYIIYRSRKQPAILKYWGFRTDNFRSVIKMLLPFAIFALITCVAVGIYRNTIIVSWHIIPILLLYPLWGVIQQYLLIALTTGNLQDLQQQKFNKGIIIFFAAILFAIVHYPFTWLIIGTFFLATIYGWVYWKERNLYVLGLFHGWLGGIFYYTVLGRDPFAEVFGKLFG